MNFMMMSLHSKKEYFCIRFFHWPEQRENKNEA